MAIIHRADIRPTKLELIRDWLPSQSWYTGDAPPQLLDVGAYRFDDPHGEVGIETLLVRADDDRLLQVPLTYRGAPLPGGQTWLIATMEHSVLGQRWVYDACGDPVYATALAATILGGGTQAEELVEVDGRWEPRTPTVSVMGGGSPGKEIPVVAGVEELTCSDDDVQTVVNAGGLELGVRRIVDPSVHTAGEHTLTGIWSGQEQRVLLATAQRT